MSQRRTRNPGRERGISDEEVERTRDEIAGALWSQQTGLEWARKNASSIGELALAEELDQVLEWLYYLADALTGTEEEVKPWNGSPIPLTGKPIPLIQRWLGVEGLARIGDELRDESEDDE